MYVQAVSILLDNIFAGHRRAVLYHYDFKILQTLLGQTLQQFIDLVGSIVYGYNDRILHNCEISKRWGMSKIYFSFLSKKGANDAAGRAEKCVRRI
jgi:hypothetical protein